MNKAIIAVAAMALSGAAFAGPSWTYVDLGYVTATGDRSSSFDKEDTDGVSLRGSFGFGMWHIQGAIVSAEVDGGKGSSANGLDLTTYALRGGLHPAMTDNTDFVLDIGYEGGEAKGSDTNGSFKTKPNSYDIRTGVRSNIGKMELRSFISLGQTDPDQGDSFRSIVYSVGGQYNFTDLLSVGIDTLLDGDRNQSNLYFRVSF